jgi:hypothetical protein
MAAPAVPVHFPTPLTEYPTAAGGLWETLTLRVAQDPFNLVATAIFVLAILHTFAAPRFMKLAHEVQHRFDPALGERRAAALCWRSRGRLRVVGGGADDRRRALRRLGNRQALPQ